MIQFRSRDMLEDRDLGWLQARHHFTVSSEGNPAHGPLGSLVVWNDDLVAPGTGFPAHGHQDIEIITYVRTGAIAHTDSLGNVGRIESGDVQALSAGIGVRHAEHNPTDEPLKVFQIWLLPRQRGGAPRWESRKFPKSDRAGRFLALASGDPADAEALPIRADARVLGATLLAGGTITHRLAPGRHAYLAPAEGVLVVNGQRLEPGDGIAAVDEPELTIVAEKDAEFILVDAA